MPGPLPITARVCRAILALALLLGPGATGAAFGSQPADPQPETANGPPLTAESLRALVAGLESQTGLDEATRQAALDLYNDALANLQRRDEASRRLADFLRATAEAPALLDSIRTELATPATEATPQVTPDATVQQLEQGLAQAQAELAAARQQADDLQSEGTRRSERRPAINEQLTSSRKLLAETDEALRTLAPAASALLNDARKVSLQTRRDALVREIEALEAEANSYDARRDLLPARRDRAVRRVSNSQKLADRWQTLVSERRQADAEQAVREAERLRHEAARQHPVLRAFAEETQALARLRLGETGTAQQLSELAEQQRATLQQLAGLREGYQAIQRRIQATDLNRATGLLLRRQYEQLPGSSDLRRDFRNVTKRLEAAEIEWIERDEQRTGAGDISNVVDELMLDIERNTDEAIENRADLETAARELATNRRDVLGTLVKDASDRFQLLLALSESSKELLDSVEAYGSYIEERILWIRSIAQDRVPSLADIADGLGWLSNPAGWGDAMRAISREFFLSPVLGCGAGLLLLLLVLAGLIARSRLRQLAGRVAGYRTDSFTLTALGVVYTIVAALPVPAALYAAGWILLRPADQADVAVAVGGALQRSAFLALLLVYSRLAVMPGGLFDAHFRWPAPALRSIRAHLRWFIPTVLPIVIVGEVIQHQSGEELVATIGRVAFAAHMILLATLVQRLLRPRGPTMGEYHKRHQGTLLNRARYLIFLLAVGLPISLTVVSWLGYHYTATQLFRRVQHSLFLVVALILVYSLLQRWLFIARRRVAIDDARRRREQAQAESRAADRAGPPDDERFDLPAISAQTQQLFRASMFLSVFLGFYAIWASTLPALRMLERVQIWPTPRIVQTADDAGVELLNSRTLSPSPQATAAAPTTGAQPEPPSPPPSGRPEADTPNGAPESSSVSAARSVRADSPSPDLIVSLADLGLTLIVLIATVIAFRNIPGLVEIVVLQRLPLDAGSRYALSTVLRYLIAIIGVTIALNAVGITWGKVQWLAAALTFGLAFGLQEIFANFVSGLIILAERPIRVGDTVTAGGVSGNVTRIRMRATTILDWDRKELVIPNKSFITDQIINWTLTDPMLRLVVPVGVGYGSDVDKVESLLLRVAAQNPLVLRDPKPQALFLRFADSTLDFELRIFIPSIEHLVVARHQLHNAIFKLFREAGVEIAFPQRDLHIRTADASFRFLPTKPEAPVDALPADGRSE